MNLVELGYGLMTYAFLLSLFHQALGLPARTTDFVLGAWVALAPWVVWRAAAAGAGSQGRSGGGGLGDFLALGMGVVPGTLVLAGLLAACPSGLLTPARRGLGSLLAALPVTGALWVAAAAIAAPLARGSGVFRRGGELALATAGLAAIALGLADAGAGLVWLGGGFRAAAWTERVGRLSAGGFDATYRFVSLASLAGVVAAAIWWVTVGGWGEDAAAAGDGEGRGEAAAGGGASGAWGAVATAFRARYGSVGLVALAAVPWAVKALAVNLPAIGRYFQPVAFGPAGLAFFLVAVSAAVFVTGGAEWVLPPEAGEGAGEARRLAGGAIRVAVGLGLVAAGVLASGALPAGFVGAWVATAAILAAPCLGLGLFAGRWPGGGVGGAVLYTLATAVLVSPHLLADGALAFLVAAGGGPSGGFLAGWSGVKLLLCAASAGFGVLVPLVYCQAWSQPPTPPETCRTAPEGSGPSPRGTPSSSD